MRVHERRGDQVATGVEATGGHGAAGGDAGADLDDVATGHGDVDAAAAIGQRRIGQEQVEHGGFRSLVSHAF
jgi:hypothetical protein